MYGVDDPAVEEAVRAYVKLMRASRSVLAQIEPGLAARGLTPTQLGVLEALLHQGAMTHRDLGRKVLTSAGNMTDVVDKLERRGLVRRVRDQADRRAVRVELTDAGQALIQEVFPRHAADIASWPGWRRQTCGNLARCCGRSGWRRRLLKKGLTDHS